MSKIVHQTDTKASQQRLQTKPASGPAANPPELFAPLQGALDGHVESQAEALQRLHPPQQQAIVQRLSQTRGNHYVQRLVSTMRPDAQPQSGARLVIQPKLLVGAADDAYEREADRVAQQVVTAPAQTSLAGTGVQRQGEAEDIQARAFTNSGKHMQRKTVPAITKTGLSARVVQRDSYAYGGPNTTPHIHCYGPDSHLKVAGGDRYDLVKKGFRVEQSTLNDAFDRVRTDYPMADNPVRTGVLAAMKTLLRNAKKRPVKK
jgi:hypothetical protein